VSYVQNKIFLSLFLFSSMLFSATFNVVTFIPNQTVPGGIYPLEYSVCFNHPQTFQILYLVSNQTQFEGSEFKFTNCYYENLSYICNYTTSQGKHTIKQNMTINRYIEEENFSIQAIFATQNAEENNCNPIYPAPAPSTSSNYGSSGGSFVPRPYYPPAPVVVKNETELNEPAIPQKTPPNVTNITIPKPPQANITNKTPPTPQPKAENITTTEKEEKEFIPPPNLFEFASVVFVLCILTLGVAIFMFKLYADKKEELPSEKMKKIIEENEGKTEI
jgi:hypothetical protein